MNDTIAAIASGMTASGIGIIRISGPEAFSVLEAVFRPARGGNVKEYKTHTIHYGHIFGKERLLDECLVSVMRGPSTYTTEDTVEINCHGGPFVMSRVLDTVLRAGARLAEPGEFTKRAFLGGRIDLTEAEAVMDVIRAKSDDALSSSELQLNGSIFREIRELRGLILDELSYIEAALDDPEHYEMENYGVTLLANLAPVRECLLQLETSYDGGKYVRDGIRTVILGKPNAGKSSLLNALSGEDRAIVTDIEGTTRDVLEEEIRVGGLLLRIMDTAGIRDARDVIEQIGIERAIAQAEHADLILAVFDASRPFDENDRQILKLIRGRRAIILLNKTDIASGEETRDVLAAGNETIPVISISALLRKGLFELEAEIRRLFFRPGVSWNEELQLTNVRHRQAVGRALLALDLVERSVGDGMTEDFFAVDLMEAYRALGEIIGEEVGDDLIDNIFSKFCMGK